MCFLLSLFQKKTWNIWMEEECVATKNPSRLYLTHKKLLPWYDILPAIKHFPILKESGVNKIKDKIRKEFSQLSN